MKKSVRLPYKLFATFMALLVVFVSVPFAFAANTLSSSNVTEWPTVTYKNGEAMYFGQSVGDAVSLTGGTVTYNGSVVPGHFEFIDSNETPTLSGTQRSNIKFVPDNTDEYTGFEAKRNRNVTYVVSETTPVYSDEINDPVTATKVEAGAALSTSVLSGGKMKNPYNDNEAKLQNAEWQWKTPSTIVNESGYYEAVFLASGYTEVVANVYVELNVTILYTEITELPAISELTYDGITTWADITPVGGVAVVTGTADVVDGTFEIADSWKRKVIEVGTYEIDATFIPADAEAYTKADCKIPVTVNKATMKFADENGNEIVPEITVPYGTKFGDIPRLLRPYISGGPDVVNVGVVGAKDTEVCKDGTYTASVVAPNDSANYERTELSFKIIIEKKVLKPVLKATEGAMLIVDSSAIYRPTGTFTLKYTIDGVEQEPLTGIKYNTAFEWNPTKSGNYEYTVIYNEAEVDEYFIIEDFVTSNPVKLIWEFSATGSVDGKYTYGDEIKLEAPETDPERADKPYYGFVKWIDNNGNTGLSDEDLENRAITFSMPDGNVDLDAAYEFDFMLCVRYYVQIIVDFFTSFFNSIGTLF